MSVLTAMDIQSRGRDTTIAGRDASITLVTGFGGFTLGAVEAGNGILGLGGAGAPVIGIDGNTAGQRRRRIRWRCQRQYREVQLALG